MPATIDPTTRNMKPTFWSPPPPNLLDKKIVPKWPKWRESFFTPHPRIRDFPKMKQIKVVPNWLKWQEHWFEIIFFDFLHHNPQPKKDRTKNSNLFQIAQNGEKIGLFKTKKLIKKTKKHSKFAEIGIKLVGYYF